MRLRRASHTGEKATGKKEGNDPWGSHRPGIACASSKQNGKTSLLIEDKE
jgi:hypothetical protein